MPMPQMYHSNVLRPQSRPVLRQDGMGYPHSRWWLCQAKQDQECPCSYIWLHTWGDEYSCWKLTKRPIAGADLSKLLLFYTFPVIKPWPSLEEHIFHQPFTSWFQSILHVGCWPHAWIWTGCLEGIAHPSDMHSECHWGGRYSGQWTWLLLQNGSNFWWWYYSQIHFQYFGDEKNGCSWLWGCASSKSAPKPFCFQVPTWHHQCAIPVFDALLPEPHNKNVMALLFTCAYWHGLAKLCMHTDETLMLLDTVTEHLGQQLCHFQLKTCAAFSTQELKQEAECHQHCASESLKNDQGNSTVMAAASTSSASRRPKTFNLQTYKLHALGNYLSSICRYGTTDSYSTEPASKHTSGVSSITYMTNRESLSTALPRQDSVELMESNSLNRWLVLSVARPRYATFTTWTTHCPSVPTLKKGLLTLWMLIFISVNLKTFWKISWCSCTSTLETQLSKEVGIILQQLCSSPASNNRIFSPSSNTLYFPKSKRSCYERTGFTPWG